MIRLFFFFLMVSCSQKEKIKGPEKGSPSNLSRPLRLKSFPLEIIDKQHLLLQKDYSVTWLPRNTQEAKQAALLGRNFRLTWRQTQAGLILIKGSLYTKATMVEGKRISFARPEVKKINLIYHLVNCEDQSLCLKSGQTVRGIQKDENTYFVNFNK